MSDQIRGRIRGQMSARMRGARGSIAAQMSPPRAGDATCALSGPFGGSGVSSACEWPGRRGGSCHRDAFSLSAAQRRTGSPYPPSRSASVGMILNARNVGPAQVSRSDQDHRHHTHGNREEDRRPCRKLARDALRCGKHLCSKGRSEKNADAELRQRPPRNDKRDAPLRSAPRAIRIPISFVRSVTVKDMSAYVPEAERATNMAIRIPKLARCQTPLASRSLSSAP